MTTNEITSFTRGYIDAALWSTTIGDDFANDHNAKTGEDASGDVHMDSFGFTADDLAPETRAAIDEDCAAFVAANYADLEAYADERSYDPSEGDVWTYAGHDFWLTRNGHGAGFWDRGLGALGERLSDACKSYGEIDLYVGDDGVIHA